MVARVWLVSNESREQALRDSFARQILEAPPRLEESVAPLSFVPNVPVQVAYPLAPMPASSVAFAEMAMPLLHDVCGLNSESAVRVLYFEAEEG